MSAPHETVLLVADEPLVREATADLLDAAGYHVIQACSADEALRRLEADPHAVQVLVTDVHMPGSMDGMGLARQVDQRWPWIRLVVSSGQACYTNKDIPDHGRFVAKPWRLPTMMRAIDEAGGC